jgi:hypothetical protein
LKLWWFVEKKKSIFFCATLQIKPIKTTNINKLIDLAEVLSKNGT